MNSLIQRESNVQTTLDKLADHPMESQAEEVRVKPPVQSLRFRSWDSTFPYWVTALVLGIIQAWANRFYMGNDGVSYLDLADTYLRGDWHLAINTSWNPLYAWLICLDLLVVRPSPYWEYTSIQLLNFGIYAFTVASFEYFLRGWLKPRHGDEIAVRVIAYGLFVWSSLFLIGIWTVNADMLVAASIYISAGILLRAHVMKTVSARAAIFLGLTLAAGYYSKAVMFPLALILLSIAWFVFRWQRTLLTAFVFVIVSAPLIFGISKAAGHSTIGETGRVNYAWEVDGVAPRWWQGGPARAGQPLHPPRVVLDSPRVYAFDGIFPKATYALWYDFAYWYQGLRVWFDLRRQASVLEDNFEWLSQMLFMKGGGFLLGWGICFLLSKNKAKFHIGLHSTWPAWAVGLAGMLLYSAVHVEARYLGAFLTILFLTAYTVVQVHKTRIAAAVVAVGLLWAVIFSPKPTAGASYLPGNKAPANVAWQVADGLQKLGLRADDKVGSVNYSNRQNVFWARLARVHIVAEPDWNVDFWRLSQLDQGRVLDALAHTGASIAVSDARPPDPARAVGWRQVGSTDFYVHSLSQVPEPR